MSEHDHDPMLSVKCPMCKGGMSWDGTQVDDICVECHAELVRLRADGGRLDWLITNEYFRNPVIDGVEQFESVRAAIDAAMAEEETDAPESPDGSTTDRPVADSSGPT